MVDRVINMRGRGGRGSSFGDTVRGTGAYGVLPTDGDTQVLEKLAGYLIEDNPGFQSTIPGPAGPTFLSLTDFKAAPTSNRKQALNVSDRAPGDFYWSSANQSAGVTKDPFGGVFIPPTSDTSGASGAWLRARRGWEVDPWFFGAKGDGVADDSLALQRALDFLPDYYGSVALSPNAKYRITRPLVLRRGHCFSGDGSPEIIADFSGSNWAGDYTALKFLIDASSGGNGAWIAEAYGQRSGGFRLTGLNNASLISRGIRYYTDQTIAVVEAVNYSFLWGALSNVNIRRFDTAIVLNEAWCSAFVDVNCTYCRRALTIDGKSVNVTFVGFQAQNPDDSYTSSTDPTVGVEIKSGFQYASGAEGRPEGITFTGGLIFGFFNNVKITNCLSVTFASMILDGSIDNCVEIVGPDFVTFRDCYVYTAGVGKAGINFQPVAVGSSAATHVENCQFVGIDGNQSVAINFATGGQARKGLSIINNKGQSLEFMVYAEIVPEFSNFTGNTCEFHTGTAMMYFQTGGYGSVVDANSCSTDDVYPVQCHPTTSENLSIGRNFSPTYQTSYAGSVTIASGANEAVLPNKMYDSEMYIRAITTAVPNANVGAWYVVGESDGSDAEITLLVAASSDVSIRYTVTCVPYSGVV